MTGTQVGAYRLLEQIGAGGMGAVWLAEHAMLGRRAAVKILHKDYSARSEIVARFFNEARAATAISDPGIVQIFDFGHHIDGTAYIVMELLEGEALDKRIRSRGPMPIFDALRVIRQVASSLASAHARGIVHRDLKPENIFLVRDAEVPGGERAKILDFGIAKLQGDRVGWRTETSQVMGTPLYMSPEQCRGAGMVDHRTDIYSLGCMLFVLVTGRPPFLAEGSGDLIAMHLREPPPLASSFNVRVTPELDQLIGRCLAKDPAQRFASGTELANAIALLLGTRPSAPVINTPVTQQPFVAKGATTLSASSGMIAVPAGTAPTSAGGKRRPVFALVAGAAVLAGVVAFAIIQGGKTVEKAPIANDPLPATTAAAADASASPIQPATTQPPAAQPPADEPKPDTRADMIKRVKPLGVGFIKWAAAHKDAPCPTAKDLEPLVGGAVNLQDSWSRPMTVTCTDQPAQQQIGIVSAGPDGVAGNRDDVASWTLGDDVTDLFAGPRWVGKTSRPKTTPKGTTTPKSTTTPKGTQPPPRGGDVDGDGIPDDRL
ncbi:MAG TPA: serine/threonine-protein kinase [Kofleriaceae bacterium]